MLAFHELDDCFFFHLIFSSFIPDCFLLMVNIKYAYFQSLTKQFGTIIGNGNLEPVQVGGLIRSYSVDKKCTSSSSRFCFGLRIYLLLVVIIL